MRTHARARTQYGLDADRDEPWPERAKCRDDPEAYFAPEGHPGRWNPMAALHICHSHGPVRAECAAYADTVLPRDRTSLILGGVAYDSRGQPSKWAEPARTCAQCWPERPGRKVA